MEWSGQGFEAAAVGYNSNGDYYSNHPANGFPDIGRIVSCTRHVIPQEKRRRKRQEGEVDIGIGARADEMPLNPELVALRQLCLEIANFDDANFMMFNMLRDTMNKSAGNVLPECPPIEIQLLLISTLFEKEVFSPPYDPATDRCYRSVGSYKPVDPLHVIPLEFVSVCCYDSNG